MPLLRSDNVPDSPDGLYSDSDSGTEQEIDEFIDKMVALSARLSEIRWYPRFVQNLRFMVRILECMFQENEADIRRNPSPPRSPEYLRDDEIERMDAPN